ncbi:hypothetical protein BKK40_08790 [Bacillus cereus]|nr:hypothetical protein BKK40_08790 [Bacillus cereus]
MNDNFPNYTKIFEATQRRLKGIKKICSRNKEIDEVDELMFYLVGNINLRINTIFHLLENNITDGVLPLQRTLFELQIAFDSLKSANDEDKKIYVKFFYKKNNFETANKLNRFFQSSNIEIKNIATSEEIELLSQLKNIAIEEIKSEHSKGKIAVFKQWYEIASGKSLTDLCVEFQEIAYYQCYDEPSNWVHPQRIIDNMDIETFSQQMPIPFYRLMISNIYWSIDKLSNNIAFLAQYYNIVESNPLYEYGEKLVELGKQLKLLVEEGD